MATVTAIIDGTGSLGEINCANNWRNFINYLTKICGKKYLLTGILFSYSGAALGPLLTSVISQNVSLRKPFSTMFQDKK